MKWSNANDIARYIKPLKDDKKDGAMPTRRSEIELRYVQWKRRGRWNIIPDENVFGRFNAWKRNREESKSNRQGHQTS